MTFQFLFSKIFHPDPTVKRKSGFLIPSFAQTNNSENYLKVPYFFALAENRDFTFNPRIYSDNKVVYQGSIDTTQKESKYLRCQCKK